MESLFSIQRKTPVCLQIIFMHQCPRFYKSRLSFGELASYNIPILYYTRKKCGVIPVSERFFTFFGKLNDFVSALSVFSSKVFSHLPRNKASSESRGFMEKASPLDHFGPSVRHFSSDSVLLLITIQDCQLSSKRIRSILSGFARKSLVSWKCSVS